MAEWDDTRADIEFVQGDTLQVRWDLLEPDGVTVTNLTGATARLQFRHAPGGTVLDTFAAGTGLELVTPTTAGKVLLTAAPTRTAAYTWPQARYDLEFTWPDGSVTTEAWGYVTRRADITRAS